ncbi:MAG: efflux RND transporter periplasmic adaptor subunit [Bacteroidales bacterium]|nr:efflux RND transporter periplasmic adaptor subunit [Bacteroidales bacterium]
MNKRKIIIIISVVGIIVISMIIMRVLSNMKPESPKKAHTLVKRYVKVEKVKYSNIESEIISSGRVLSQHSIDISSEVQGKLLEGNVPLKKGQKFNKGDLLIRIFNEDAIYNINSRRSRFLNTLANIIPDIKVDYKENYDAWIEFFNSLDIEKNLPKLPDIKSNKEKIFLAGKNLLSDYYSIKSEEIRLKKYYIYAPFTGTYTDVFLQVGSIANPGSRIGNIIKTNKLEIEVPVDINYFNWIKIGDEVQVLTDNNKLNYKGKVIRKSNFVDTKTQSISVFVKLDVPDHQLFAGLYQKVVFPGIIIKNAMEIPRNAVFNNNEVYIVKDGKLVKKEIIIHKINQTTLIFSGLEEETELVIEPLINITENTEVEILNNVNKE